MLKSAEAGKPFSDLVGVASSQTHPGAKTNQKHANSFGIRCSNTRCSTPFVDRTSTQWVVTTATHLVAIIVDRPITTPCRPATAMPNARPTTSTGVHASPPSTIHTAPHSSGGGGGSKGPSTLDKRNEEHPCPHCDRVFKQSGRLREHIASKHADQADPPPDAAAATTTAPAQSVMDVGSKAGAYDRKSPKLLLQEHCLKLKQPKPRYTLTDGGRTCKVMLVFGACTLCVWCVCCVLCVWGVGGVLCGVWCVCCCQTRTLPRPLLAQHQHVCSSSATAHMHAPSQVVLPGPKPNDPPTVLRYRAPDGVDEEDDVVAQRGALVALHHVAGQRRLDLVLPDAFTQQWRALGEQVGG